MNGTKAGGTRRKKKKEKKKSCPWVKVWAAAEERGGGCRKGRLRKREKEAKTKNLAAMERTGRSW